MFSLGLSINEGLQVITPVKRRRASVGCASQGLALTLTLFALNFLGDGLRDALDPLYEEPLTAAERITHDANGGPARPLTCEWSSSYTHAPDGPMPSDGLSVRARTRRDLGNCWR
jgi:hypothetical protein